MTEKDARRYRLMIIIAAFGILIALCILFAPEAEAKEMPRPDYHVPWIEERFEKDVYLSDEDFKLLCRTVFCEAGNQSLEAQRLCAVVILNRVGSDYFPDTLREVIYQDGGKQFNAIWREDFDYVDFRQWTDYTEMACYLALATYPEEPGSLLFFRSGKYFREYEPYIRDGDMYFSIKGE